MNKRIMKELIQQTSHDSYDRICSVIDIEKFAELIILKCADISAKHWVKYKGCSAHFSIREHFGVEEWKSEKSM